MSTPERVPLPWCRNCLVCGEDNPIGMRARMFKVGDEVQLPWTTRLEHSARRRVFDIQGLLLDENGRVYAHAHGRYMPAPRERVAHLRDEFVTSSDCLDLSHIFGPMATP